MKSAFIALGRFNEFTLKGGFALFVLFMIGSCIRPQEKLQREITNAEQELASANDALPSFEKADSLLKMYLNYAEQYKDDTLSPSYLFKAGELSMKVQRYSDAINYFNSVQRYKNFNRLPEALFFQAYLYDSQLQDTANARKYYEQFVMQYPRHELADDATHLLENLMLTPEQLIQKLEAVQQRDSMNKAF
jgi:tetratricopeptide (TPR) repeat protein